MKFLLYLCQIKKNKDMKSVKRILVVLMVAMFSIGAANAQFRFGVKAGLNLNKLDFKNLEDNLNGSNGCGYTVGLMTEFQVPIIGLCLDASLMYTRMNSESEIVEVLEDGTEKEFAGAKNFLEIPINIKYKFTLPVVNNFLSPYLFTGPTFAIKLDKNTIDYFKSKTCQVAWNVGLGVELFKHLQVGASYGFGINNIAKSVGANAQDLKVKNNYWTISAAYLF